MRKLNIATLVALLAIGATSCGPLNKTIITPVTVALICSATPEDRFSDLDRGLDLTVTSDVGNNDIYDGSELGFDQKTTENVKNSMTFYPTVKEFVTESMSTYIRSSGIALGSDLENDYRLNVRVREFKLVDGRGSARAVVVLDYSLINTDNEVIIQNTARGRAIVSGTNVAQRLLDQAYSKALKDINWVSIADALKVHRRANQESQRQVEGDGDTALEHTVIVGTSYLLQPELTYRGALCQALLMSRIRMLVMLARLHTRLPRVLISEASNIRTRGMCRLRLHARNLATYLSVAVLTYVKLSISAKYLQNSTS